MKPRVLAIVIGLILISGIVGAVLGHLFITLPEGPGIHPRWDLEVFKTFLTAKSAITMINMTISTILIAIYVKLYRNTKSEFTIGLIIVMLALLLYAITSNPLSPMAFGFRNPGLGPFSLLPDLFTTIALAVLLYLSLK